MRWGDLAPFVDHHRGSLAGVAAVAAACRPVVGAFAGQLDFDYLDPPTVLCPDNRELGQGANTWKTSRPEVRRGIQLLVQRPDPIDAALAEVGHDGHQVGEATVESGRPRWCHQARRSRVARGHWRVLMTEFPRRCPPPGWRQRCCQRGLRPPVAGRRSSFLPDDPADSGDHQQSQHPSDSVEHVLPALHPLPVRRLSINAPSVSLIEAYDRQHRLSRVHQPV